MKELTKEERLQFGIDTKKQPRQQRSMMKDYLKIPLSNANHPVKTSRISALMLNSQVSQTSPLNQRSSIGSAMEMESN